MKSALAIALVFLSTLVVASHGIVHQRRFTCKTHNHTNTNTSANTGTGTGTNTNANTSANTKTNTSTSHSTSTSDSWVQNPSGQASFTKYSGCETPSCGISMTSGYTAAINQLTFGSASSYGDACGRCFKIAASGDPYSPSYSGSMGNSIIVRVSNLCPIKGNEVWCGQTVSHPLNQFNMPVHFDLCEDSGAASAFFPGDRGAMVGTYEEVSCTEWQGVEGSSKWPGSCMAPNDAPLWPNGVSCGNEGSPPP